MIYTYSIKIQTDLSEGEILVNAMSEDEAMAIAERNGSMVFIQK